MSLKNVERYSILILIAIWTYSEVSNKRAAQPYSFWEFFSIYMFFPTQMKKKFPIPRFFTYINEKNVQTLRLFATPHLLDTSEY